jgi:predicted Ser/Thr protein kinase
MKAPRLADIIEERVLRAGTGMRASVKLVRLGETLAVLKDYRGCTLPMRFVGRWLISREIKALARLNGLEGIPRFLGRPDPHCLLIEHLDGQPVSKLRREDMPPDLLHRLRVLVEQVHSRGVVHCDVKHPDNLIISPDGQLYLVDWAAALLRPRPFNLPGRWVYRMLEADDLKAVHKMRYYVLPGLSPEEWEMENLSTMPAVERIARAVRDALRALARWALSRRQEGSQQHR